MQTATALKERPADPRDLPHVDAVLGYINRGTGKPALDATVPGTRVKRNFLSDPRSVRIANARLAPTPSLDREGFALARHQTALANFDDEEAIKAVYYPEMSALIRKATGATRVVVFDHNVRLDAGDGVARGNHRPAVRRVHNDYTLKSAPQRLTDILGDATGAIRRYAVVNVWRPIKGPVQTAPLAFADAASVAPEDFVATDLVYPDRVGEIYYATWSPAHRWSYVPQMEPTEALLIKGYDSLNDGRARFSLHTAFDDPTTPGGAAPRESIEVRALALFE